MTETKQAALDKLHDEIRACTRCELRAGCTQVVPGEGVADAGVCFFAEAPGESEDEKGRPLIGRSGSLFREALMINGIKGDSVYISNGVRCRPPNNRDPSPAEKTACFPWTMQTLQIIQPKVIVTLGRHALESLAARFGFMPKIGQKGITKVAGVPIFIEDRKFYVFPITHPSYAMRRNDAREEFMAYFAYLRKALPGWLRR